jgi:hypothetical protein
VTAQVFWIALAVFLAGLFIGSNLGVVVMCALQLCKRNDAAHY